jgi:hypothetical protein
VDARRCAACGLTGTGRQDRQDIRLWADRPEHRLPRPWRYTEVCAIRRDVGQSAEDDLTLLGIPNIIDEVLRRSDYVVISMGNGGFVPSCAALLSRPRFRLHHCCG